MRRREWAAFWLLGLIWGSSFLWIKLAVEDISPSLLVALRLAFGLLGLAAWAVLRRQSVRWPSDRAGWGRYFFMGVVNTALPIALISWSELHIASGLAAILNATTPLFTLIIAHLWLHDERITPTRLLGLAAGFLGVLVVVLPDLMGSEQATDLVGQLAVLLAAACYATGSTFSRRHLRSEPAFTQAFLVLLTADAVSWVFVLAGERPIHWPSSTTTWFAAAWLGILGSGLAYLLYFFLIRSWGVTRTSMVTYVLPVLGLLLGSVYLDEAIGWNMLAGLGLILVGIAWVSRAAAQPPSRQHADDPPPSNEDRGVAPGRGPGAG